MGMEGVPVTDGNNLIYDVLECILNGCETSGEVLEVIGSMGAGTVATADEIAYIMRTLADAGVNVFPGVDRRGAWPS